MSELLKLAERCERATGPDRARPGHSVSVPNAVLPGDVVQITSADHHWFPCLIVVSELKAFGVMGFAFMPVNDGSGTGEAYIRLSADEYERVCGPLPITTLSLIKEREEAIATEARRAETVKQGSVHEGAGPKDIAQRTNP